MADLDHFKKINDRYGHLAGDIVLREVAARLQRAVRPYDTVGRYGGEEIVIIFPGCDTSAIWKRAEQLRLAVSNEPVSTAEGDLRVTMSMGAIAVCAQQQDDPTAILKLADDALYRAKRKGRNRVELAVPDGCNEAVKEQVQ